MRQTFDSKLLPHSSSSSAQLQSPRALGSRSECSYQISRAVRRARVNHPQSASGLLHSEFRAALDHEQTRTMHDVSYEEATHPAISRLRSFLELELDVEPDAEQCWTPRGASRRGLAPSARRTAERENRGRPQRERPRGRGRPPSQHATPCVSEHAERPSMIAGVGTPQFRATFHVAVRHIQRAQQGISAQHERGGEVLCPYIRSARQTL